jgi:two-component system sensor histidine kinase HydH
MHAQLAPKLLCRFAGGPTVETAFRAEASLLTSSRLPAHTTLWLLGVSLLLGSVLVVSAVDNYRTALAEKEAATTHEGVAIFERLSIDWGAPDQVLAEELAAGLAESQAMFLGVWENDRLIASAGKTEFPDLGPTPFKLQLERNRARMSFPGLYKGPRDRPPPTSTFVGLRLPTERVFVVEFVPHAAQALASRALGGLILASSVAILLTSAASFIWRMGRRGEQLRLELERKEHLARLGAMSAVLAHEIRNPLASLKGHAQLLAEEPHDPRTAAKIDRVVKDAIRLEVLTNDLLQFARSGSVHASPSSPVEVLEAAALSVDVGRVRVSTEGAPERWSLDAGRMEQVLINLLDNALRVTPEGKKVSAEVGSAGKELVYTVRDHGPGVPSAQRARIFDAFHTTNHRGTGLGLAVARRIVELHGGRIEVDDGPEGGAVFRVRLPALASQPIP